MKEIKIQYNPLDASGQSNKTTVSLTSLSRSLEELSKALSQETASRTGGDQNLAAEIEELKKSGIGTGSGLIGVTVNGEAAPVKDNIAIIDTELLGKAVSATTFPIKINSSLAGASVLSDNEDISSALSKLNEQVMKNTTELSDTGNIPRYEDYDSQLIENI